MRQFFSVPISACVILLAACAAPEQIRDGSRASETEGTLPSIREIDEGQVSIISPSADRQFIADLLYEALQALDSDRLLTPVDDNAHSRFKRVLAYEPGNEIALQGLKDIVQRYLQLAEQSMRRGLFEEAKVFIENAKFIDEDDPGIVEVSKALEAEMNSADLFFNLDNGEFAARTDAAIDQLKDIARQAQATNAFFLITAPNDALARWMFGVMRDAVTGYRLRGNIELASQTSIRLRLPEAEE